MWTMLGREYSWFARVSLLQRGHQCISENEIRWFDRRVSLVGIASFFFNMISFLSPGPSLVGRLFKMCRTTLQNVPNKAKGILMSDPWSRVGVFEQTGPISLEQPDLRESDTFVYPAWMLCFGHFAGLGYQQHNISRPRGFLFSFLSAIVRTILALKWR